MLENRRIAFASFRSHVIAGMLTLSGRSGLLSVARIAFRCNKGRHNPVRDQNTWPKIFGRSNHSIVASGNMSANSGLKLRYIESISMRN